MRIQLVTINYANEAEKSFPAGKVPTIIPDADTPQKLSELVALHSPRGVEWTSAVLVLLP